MPCSLLYEDKKHIFLFYKFNKIIYYIVLSPFYFLFIRIASHNYQFGTHSFCLRILIHLAQFFHLTNGHSFARDFFEQILQRVLKMHRTKRNLLCE